MKHIRTLRVFKLGTYAAIAAVALHGCSESGAPLLDLGSSKQGSSGGFADVDGDGNLDLIVGAPSALYQGHMGVAMVYAGDGAGFTPEPSIVLHGDRDFGASFAPLGDVDGDGQDDFAIGAVHGDGAGVSLSGSVAVFAGGKSGVLLTKLGGEAPAAKFGWSMAGGDFNGDGAADIAIGSPYVSPDPALYQQGAVYVYFGPSLDPAKAVALRATASTKGLGWAVAAGDIDGDGVDDLVVSKTGGVAAYFGAGTFAPSIDAPDVEITGAATHFGRAIAVVGDVDADGLRDLAIGAPRAQIGDARDVGSVYLVRAVAGSATVDVIDEIAPPNLVARIDGPGVLTRFGASLAVVPDMDADGKPELAVGSPFADDQLNDLKGKVYLFFGKDLTPAVTLASAKWFTGAVSDENFGTFVGTGGAGRLLAGAPRAHGGVGAAYVVDLSAAGGQGATSPYTGGSAGESCHEE